MPQPLPKQLGGKLFVKEILAIFIKYIYDIPHKAINHPNNFLLILTYSARENVVRVKLSPHDLTGIKISLMLISLLVAVVSSIDDWVHQLGEHIIRLFITSNTTCTNKGRQLRKATSTSRYVLCT